MHFRRTLCCLAAAAIAFSLTVTERAQAQPGTAQAQVVSAVPASYTPNIDGGVVYSIAQIGTTIVAGGTFTSATPHGSTTAVSDKGLVAFDQSTGALNKAFAPTLDGAVDFVLAGPTAGTVYVGGAFATVNGVKSKGIVLLNVSNGSIVSTWKPAVLNGAVDSARVSGGMLFVTGSFTTVGGVAHSGIVTLNPTTGALNPYLNVQLTGHHNYNGSGASGGVGGRAMDISPDGTRAIVVGNFKNANGVVHDQVVMLDLGATTATVDSWNTSEFSAPCASSAFDSYVEDVDFSQDGSYFAIAATGGDTFSTNTDGSRSLCDSATRWSTTDTGPNVQPTWVDYTGNDSFWSVAITGSAVYLGGHARWINNPNGSDSPGAGAVPRPGIIALDPVSGLPLTWNPGRNPRGAGAYALLATAQGLWVGSDTNYIGDYKYKHDEIAFFPLTGGYTPAATTTQSLPANVYTAGALPNSTNTDPSDLSYRADSGTQVGPSTTVAGTGIDWSTTRGAFVVGSTIFYGSTDGNFYRAGFNGKTVGAPVAIDPYDDPTWDGVQTGSGQTYQGAQSDFYAEIPNVTGAFYSDGRMYYSLSGQNTLFWRYFTPDSGTIGGTENTVAGGDFANTAGEFLSGSTLYYANGADGTLHTVAFTNGGTNGTNPSVDSTTDATVSGPALDGNDWRARGLFAFGKATFPDQPPTASATATCTNLSCAFDGSASTDADGTIASYAWTFGDGTSATGEFPTHGYATAGTFSYTLTVTDDQGSTGTTTFSGSVTTTAPSTPQISFVTAAHTYAAAATVKTGATITTPGLVTAGDTELLYVTTGVSGAARAPAGWIQVVQQNSAPAQVTLYKHIVVSGDAGKKTTVAISATTPVALQLVDYRGVGSSVAATGSADATTATHVAPAANVTAAGSWVASFWADKSSTTTAWNLPSAVSARDTAIGTGSGRITDTTGDSGAIVVTGTYPAQAATVTGGASTKGVNLTVILGPAS